MKSLAPQTPTEDKKKGSSFGTTAAASRGVFYECLESNIIYCGVYT